MQILSFIGILLALAIIVWGSLRSISLILLSTVAALVVAVTGGVNVIEGYAVTYMGGVGAMVVTLFPIFLGGQLFGKLLEASGLATSIANSIVKRFGTKQIVSAVFIATFLMSLGGINVFVIIFTMYPMACAFFKIVNISRNLIPACVLGAAVAHQSLPGMPIANIVLPAEALGVTPMAAPIMAIVGSIIVFGGNLWYVNHAAKKYLATGQGFVPKDDDQTEVNLDADGLPNPFLIFIPMAIVVVLLNVVGWPAWASLYTGAVVIAIMFFKRIGKNILKLLTDGAAGSQSVVATAAICGFGSIVTAVPGYVIIQDFLTRFSFGSPYILAALSVALIAAVTGSATGGLQFAVAEFSDRMIAMGGNPQAIARIISQASITFDSMPHNSAIVLTLSYCGVSHKDGYKHLFVTTVLMTTLSTVSGILLASIGIV